MCLEDLWIARHQRTTYRGTVGLPTILPANPQRIALRVSRAFVFIVADSNNRELYYFNAGRTVTSFSTSVNAVVPPGVETGTITETGSNIWFEPLLLHVKDFGSVIQEELRLSYVSHPPELWEITMDIELQEALAKKEKQWR